MNVEDIAKLIELIDRSSLSELQWNVEGETLLLKKPEPSVVQFGAYPTVPSSAAPIPSALPMAVAPTAAPSGPPPTSSLDSGLVEIKSPMVGTFYRSASPETAPYVEEGGRIEKGKPICIVEAMKLMNEIESDASGTIVKVCVQNEQPVEFGTVLFLVRP